MKEYDLEWAQSQYKVYTINRNNKSRQIEEPSEELKAFQRQLIHQFEDFPFHPSCHSIKNRSIATNAAAHKNAKYLLNIDIKNCYQNTFKNVIIKGFKSVEAYSDKQLYNFQDNLQYCLWFDRKRQQWRLPTGAPTSPILCNIALTYIDNYLSNHLLYLGYTYTRYIDDLCISTTNKKRDWNIKGQVEEFVNTKTDYRINRKKSKWITINSDKAVITGVKLGGTNKVPRAFYRMMRAKLNNLAKAGQPIDQETRGCLSYINSIDPPTYEYLLTYYEKRK